MTKQEAIGKLKAMLECTIRDVSGSDQDCNNRRCFECDLNYAKGNMGEKKECLKMAIEALEKEPRKGHWIVYNWNDNGLARWGIKCDKCCKKYKYGGEIWNSPNFCPNCGCNMREE